MIGLDDNPYVPPEGPPDLELTLLRRRRDQCVSVAAFATLAGGITGFGFTTAEIAEMHEPISMWVGSPAALGLYASLMVSATLAGHPRWGAPGILGTWAAWIALLAYVRLRAALDGRGLADLDAGLIFDLVLLAIPGFVAIVASLVAIVLAKMIRRLEAARAPEGADLE